MVRAKAGAPAPQKKVAPGFRGRASSHARLLYMIHELSRLISTHFDATVASHQLTHAQWWALMHIAENEGVTQTELASIMQMGRASAGRLLERLEEKKWIERRNDASDSRVRRVFLAKGATPIFEVMNAAGLELFARLMNNVSADEVHVLIEGLSRIKANAGEPPEAL